jgi:hypothetical protein
MISELNSLPSALNRPSLLFCRNPYLVATDMDGETVMMHMELGEYYGIGGVGTFCWELLAEPSSINTLVDAVCEKFDTSHELCQKDIELFIDQLMKMNLVNSVETTD